MEKIKVNQETGLPTNDKEFAVKFDQDTKGYHRFKSQLETATNLIVNIYDDKGTGIGMLSVYVKKDGQIPDRITINLVGGIGATQAQQTPPKTKRKEK